MYMYVHIYIHIYRYTYTYTQMRIGVVQWSFSAMAVLAKDLSNARKMLLDNERSSPQLSLESGSWPSSPSAIDGKYVYVCMYIDKYT
jgi:hypothetical protein